MKINCFRDDIGQKVGDYLNFAGFSFSPEKRGCPMRYVKLSLTKVNQIKDS